MVYKEDTDDVLKAFPRPVKTYHKETYDRISPKHVNNKDKTLLITGGATGIGKEVSKAFAETGVSRIVILARSKGPLEKAQKELEEAYSGLKVDIYSASITDTDRMAEVVNEIGPIDIFVSNSAHFHTMKAPSKDLPLSEFKQSYDTNIIAPFHMLQLFLNQAAPASGKRTYINISSGAAHAFVPNQVGYGSTKAAFAKVVYALALENTDPNVKLFTIHPGAIYTEAAATVLPKDDPRALQWEDIKLPAHFSTWLSSGEGDFLQGRFLWAHWDVDELLSIKEKFEKDPGYVTIGLQQD